VAERTLPAGNSFRFNNGGKLLTVSRGLLHQAAGLDGTPYSKRDSSGFHQFEMEGRK
jgi:hypothetical protein